MNDEGPSGTVAALFAVDPAGLGGVALRARAGGHRETWLQLLPPEGHEPVRQEPVGAAPADQCFNSWRNRPGRALHSHQKLPAYAVECRTTSLPAAFKRCRMTPAGGVISFAGHTRRLQKLFQPKISL